GAAPQGLDGARLRLLHREPHPGADLGEDSGRTARSARLRGRPPRDRLCSVRLHGHRHHRVHGQVRRIRMRTTLLLLLLAGPAMAQAPSASFNVDTAESSVVYHLVHKLHKFDGTSKKLDGKAVILSDGRAQVMLRVPVESFDSGNVNRDAHM